VDLVDLEEAGIIGEIGIVIQCILIATALLDKTSAGHTKAFEGTPDPSRKKGRERRYALDDASAA